MTYPARIRESLTASRARGLDFTTAWNIALEEHPAPAGRHPMDNWVKSLPFLMRAMKAAYERKPLSRSEKPTRLEPPETASEAVTRPQDAPQRGSKPKRTTQPRCKSGDGCSRVATHGRWGPRFCEDHHAEIHRAMAREIQRTPQAKQTEEWWDRKRAGKVYGFADVSNESRKRGAANGAPARRKKAA